MNPFFYARDCLSRALERRKTLIAGGVLFLAAMIVGDAICYFFGTVWFMVVYARTEGPVGVLTALGWCVFPFIIPDLIKLTLALLLARRMPSLPG